MQFVARVYAHYEILRELHASKRSEVFLALDTETNDKVLYELLTGALPYGETDRPGPRRHYNYTSARRHAPDIPTWVDGALAKAVNPDPRRRYEALSEFQHDLEHPNPAFADPARLPLMERNPLVFWRGLAGLLFIIDLTLLVQRLLNRHALLLFVPVTKWVSRVILRSSPGMWH